MTTSIKLVLQGSTDIGQDDSVYLGHEGEIIAVNSFGNGTILINPSNFIPDLVGNSGDIPIYDIDGNGLVDSGLNYTSNILSADELTIQTSSNLIFDSNIIASVGNIIFSNCSQNINQISNIFNVYGDGCFQVGIKGNINFITDDNNINFTASNGMIIQNYGNDNKIICKNGTGVSFQYNSIESYVLPTTKPNDGDFLICVNDSGSPSVLDWAPSNINQMTGNAYNIPVFKGDTIGLEDSNVNLNGGNLSNMNNIIFNDNFNLKSNTINTFSYLTNDIILTTPQNGKTYIQTNAGPACQFDNENKGICDLWLNISGTNSLAIDGFGPKISVAGSNIDDHGLLFQVGNNAGIVLLNHIQETTPYIIFTCGGSSGYNGTIGLSGYGEVPNDGTIYKLPSTIGSVNDVLTLTSNTGIMEWTTPSSGSSNSWIHQHICWNTFSYFKPATDLTVDYLVQSNQAWGDGSGSSGNGLSPYDFGNITISLNAGTYRFSFTAIAGTDQGIVDFTINSITTSFDMYYGMSYQACRSWDQVITIPGNYTINCAVNSKNPSSTKYFFLPMNTALYCNRIL